MTSMREQPVEIIIAGFSNESGAKEAVTDLNEAKKQGFITIRDVAVLTRDTGKTQKLHISETADKGFGRGAVIGGVAGAAVGLLAGPIGWATLGGAAIGGLASKLRDTGFPDEDLRRMGDNIRPGHAAVIAVVEPTYLENVTNTLSQHGGEVTMKEVPADLAAQLDKDAAKAQESGTSSQT